MSDIVLCNATAVRASLWADPDTPPKDWERVVTLVSGVIGDDGSRSMHAGLALTAEQAREVADELIAAADQVDSGQPLPVDAQTMPPVAGRA